jgi:hypothetical protein
MMYLDSHTRLALGRDRMDTRLRRADRERLAATLTADRNETRATRTMLRRALRRTGELAQARAQ